MGKYFGTDGVRGVANVSLTNEMVYRIGRYLGYYYAQKGQYKVIIGKDTRLSGSMFEASLAAGLMASGCHAYLMGYGSTPALAYLASREDFACGVMISASHNPYEDNGIKIFGGNGLKISGDIENLIEEYMDGKMEIPYARKEALGTMCSYREGIDHYVSWICERYPLDLSTLRIVCDLANGGSCTTAEKVFTSLKGKVDYIHHIPNGININNACGSTHLESLQEAVRQGHYDIGFAFDGDADRVLAVDSEGKVIDGDHLLYILSSYLSKNNLLPSNKTVMTVMSNIGLKKALAARGIAYEVTAVGDKNVVDCMIANHYAIGGEQSGHIINTLDSYFGDGVKTALNILQIMLAEGKSVRELCEGLSVYPQLLKNVRVKDKNAVLNDSELRSVIENIAADLGDDGRILVRPSGTEPLIRVMVEASSEKLCKDYVEEVLQKIIAKGFAD